MAHLGNFERHRPIVFLYDHRPDVSMSLASSPNLSNLRTALLAAAIVALMALLTAYSAPLYQLFCQVTGFGGAPVITEEAKSRAGPGSTVAAKELQITFDTAKSPELTWRIDQPDPLEIKVGEPFTAFYRAENPTDSRSVGMSVFNVTPTGVAPYVHKIACFCFEEQLLEAGQKRRMRVDFYIDPKVFTEPRFKNLSVITFSYSFFKAGG